MINSVWFSRSIVSNSLRPHESQHARPPCPSQTPGDHSNPRPSSRWCHPAISSSVVPFSSCPQLIRYIIIIILTVKFSLKLKDIQFSRSVVSDSVIPLTAAHQAPLSITNSQSLFKLISIELVMPPNHLMLCHPLLLLPSIFPNLRVFSNESVLCIRWPKYWSFSFRIGPSNEYSGLISFWMDGLDLLAVHEMLKNILQHHSSKASILWCSAFFIVQLSHPYIVPPIRSYNMLSL